ncbi:hypothetical protein SNE40_015638 [Patella caerulea]|uniref:Copine-8 n=1 Tax=Patella caerulea TaxID=87958 RepID=A0AAN8JKB7_PATCE
MNSFNPGRASVPVTQVEISVSCRNLRDMDTFSKSDPLCVLKMKDFRSQSYREVGRTEQIKDTLNPDFVKKFIVQYFFEERQLLRFELYDVDSHSARLDDHDYLGIYEVSLGELVSAQGSTNKPLKGNGHGNFGTISIRVEEVSTNKDEITMQFKATNLDKKDFFGKSDPFLVFYRANEDQSFTICHKTEEVKNNLNPTWRPFCVSLQALCNGDKDRSVKVECYDWNSSGSHEIIGEFITNVRELEKGPGTHNVYQVVNTKKKAKKKSYQNSGQVHLISSKVTPVYSFLDYIKGGMQMNFTVAIDFTASNGHPRQPSSLHFLNPHQPNQYAAAIQAVGEIVQDYDSDKLFPVLGFGARLPDGKVHHEFALNFNPNNPYCNGVDGILQAYYNCLPQVELYGPTNFSPVINHVARFAAPIRDGSSYFVLLIITDGVITDMPQTVKSIVEASSLPMSIIIVGVGNADFEAMDELDSDNKRLGYNGKYAEQDIVQFVPFREFIGGKYGNNIQMSKGYLAKEVLAEIPDQVTRYMKKRGIVPKPPPPYQPPASGAPVPNAAPQGAHAAPPQYNQSPAPAAPPQYNQTSANVPPYPSPGGYPIQTSANVPPYPSPGGYPNQYNASPQGGPPPYSTPAPPNVQLPTRASAPPPP